MKMQKAETMKRKLAKEIAELAEKTGNSKDLKKQRQDSSESFVSSPEEKITSKIESVQIVEEQDYQSEDEIVIVPDKRKKKNISNGVKNFPSIAPVNFSSLASSNPFASFTGAKRKLPNFLNSKNTKDTLPFLQKSRSESFLKKSEIPKIEAQKVISGEENEICLFKVRAKLYVLEQKEKQSKWREVGIGNVHVNKPNQNSTQSKHPRLVMRREGVLKLILNCNIYPNFPMQNLTEKAISFSAMNSAGSDPTKLHSFMLKCSREDQKKDLFNIIETARSLNN
eukprot:snap_masked-scaffold_1-processed-gene-5.31-mRNA-1 protein AED:1.00 eAED:1.00 QI:0/-1/0/0/-1/1/1/0/281